MSLGDLMLGRRRNKYSAIKVQMDGLTFDSKAEAARYMDLRLLERARKIVDLRCQVPFDFLVNSVAVCRYVADFVYLENGKQVVEDVKGFKTPEYILKRKLMKACFGIDILETGKTRKGRKPAADLRQARAG